jgi:Putative motility protein
MDVTSLATSFMAQKAGALQQQMATTLLKQNLDTQKSAVLTLLGGAQQSLANVGAGIGGNLNISA